MLYKKEEVLRLIEENLRGENFQKPLILYDKKFRYPNTGDSEETCPLLWFMLRIEYRTGTLIFIPDEKNLGNTGDRNQNEVNKKGG